VKTIKYFNKAIVSYSFPGYYYGFWFFSLSGTLLSHSQTEKSTGWHLHSHFSGNLCRRIVYSARYSACKGCSSEFCFVLLNDITERWVCKRQSRL